MKGFSIKRKAKDAIKNLINETAKLNHEMLSVGITDSSKHSDSRLSVATIAAINEFGTQRHPTGGNRVPARPFMAPSMAKHKKEYVAMFAKDMPKVLLRLKSKNAMYEAVGKKAVLDMKHFIKDGDFEPLSARQIKRKGHAAPLFHTFQMMDAIDYEVTKK